MSDATEVKVRIDKWLWAARFFKTRSLASEAVDAGRVTVNAARVKPAKALKVGDELIVRTARFEYTVQVVTLSERRGSAAQAAQLFIETPESVRKREQARQQGASEPDALLRGRPTKRARRQLQRIRGQP